MRALLLPLLTALGLALLLGTAGQAGESDERKRPAIDLEEHATVKTATFALG